MLEREKVGRVQSRLTCPRTKPNLRKRMTEKMDRMQGMVTPNTIVSFFCLAGARKRGRQVYSNKYNCYTMYA